MQGIIGGSGLTRLPNLDVVERRAITTPYGDPSSQVSIGTLAGHDVAFIARHGDGHSIPPHRINYRANVWAMHAAGVTDLVAVFAVGGIAPDLGPGALAIPSQLIDYTSGRDHTFHDALGEPVVHIDFTRPYTETVRARLIAAAARAGVDVVAGGTYGVVNGPRLETAAEIDRLERDGATMVGMTCMPEAGLAREIGLGYAALAMSVNHAAGRGDSAERIALDAIPAIIARSMAGVGAILENWVSVR